MSAYWNFSFWLFFIAEPVQVKSRGLCGVRCTVTLTVKLTEFSGQEKHKKAVNTIPAM